MRHLTLGLLNSLQRVHLSSGNYPLSFPNRESTPFSDYAISTLH
jgi:hypothetical protein